MNQKMSSAEPGILRNWIRGTVLGWLAGFILSVVLAGIWESFAGEAQFMVGVGMGAGVGFFQARLLRGWLPSPRGWMWASVVGMGVPFLASDIASAAAGHAIYSLPLCVVLGSTLVGILQTRLLGSVFQGTALWIPASLLGWGIPVGLIALGDWAPAPWSLVSVIAMFLGGFILGSVTGSALVHMEMGRQPA